MSPTAKPSRHLKAGAACLGSLAVAATSTAAPTAAASSRSGVQAEREATAFEHARSRAVAAKEQGDWDTFLAESERALRALEERDETHAERAQIMQPVGTSHLGDRSSAQMRRSERILELYLTQVEEAYGERAREKPGTAVAVEYLEDVRTRRAAFAPPALLPPPSAASGKHQRPVPAPRDSRPRVNGLLVGGGVSIGVGAILLAVGAVEAVRWRRAGDKYEDLRARNDAGLAVTDQAEALAFTQWKARRRTTLGLLTPGLALVGAGVALLVVGLRRRTVRNARLSAIPAGFGWRF